MLHKIVIATKNEGKVREIKKILSDMPVDVVSMNEEGIDIEIEENGSTFEDNALIKAKSVKSLTDGIVIADDSGLEVDSLGGAPGVYSARFAGDEADDGKNNAKLLSMMQGLSDRTARFVCSIAVVLPDGSQYVVRGECRGEIAHEPVGSNGFGYDPLFFLPEYGSTMAELDIDMKNRISHRAKALQLMKDKLREIL